MYIAVLGWGSLLWDQRLEFDDHHGQWEFDGPELQIEFSRISSTRGGVLTLVIDPQHGALCRVAYTISKRRSCDKAVSDLQSREGTSKANIGIYSADGLNNRSKDPVTLASISAWARTKTIDFVIWTDLASNFQDTTSSPFSIANAITHMKTLKESNRLSAISYVQQAPSLVNTPLRIALENEPWFKSQH